MTSYPLQIKNASTTNQFIEIRSPYDESLIAKVEQADGAAIQQAFINGEVSFETTMKTMPAWQRANILYQTAALIKENLEDLACTIAKEGGKPLKDARVEASRAVNTIKMSGDEALQLNGEQITMDRARGSENYLAFTIREPIGPVLAISAFNHPLNLMCHQIGTAIAAGNTVIAKPSMNTPISTLKLADFFKKAGLPEGVLSVVTATGAEIDKFIGDPRICFVSFIGGEDVGWEIRRKVAPGTRVALEHGGTGTAIIHESANLEQALPTIIKGAFYHAGQVCVSLQNLYVHKKLYTKVLRLMKEATEKLITGDPLDEKTDVGPLIRSKEIARVDEFIKEALGRGACLVTGGKPLPHNCYSPTVLADVPQEARVICNEVFGPIVSLMPYTDLDKTISIINQSRYSFQAAVYAQDITVAINAARSLHSTACIINNSPAFRVDWMPFGGAKHSGLGIGGVRYAVHDVTSEKLIVIKV